MFLTFSRGRRHGRRQGTLCLEVSSVHSLDSMRGMHTKGTGTAGKAFREVAASGSHSQIGTSLGKQCRDQVKAMEKRFKASLNSTPGITLAKAQAYAKRGLTASQPFHPACLKKR